MASLLLVFVFFNLLFCLAIYLKDNSIADIGWGVGFILFTLGLIKDYGIFSNSAYISSFLLFIWAFRLFLHILLRNKGKGEDFRYQNWRRQWGDLFLIRSYLQVFVLQMLILIIVISPISIIFIYQQEAYSGNLFAGVIICLLGLFFEIVSDYQLSVFKKNPINKGKILSEGLWSISRHPNYFGEALFWWGLAVIALNHQYALLAFLGPLLITYLLRYVSGVPMLEEKYKDNPVFQDYAKKTPCFIPKLF